MMEWPLVVFTVAIQLSCGLAMAAAFADFRASRPVMMRPAGMAVFPVSALGLLTSLLHLGRPLSAFKAIRNLAGSRLSLEVVLTILFVGVALIYSNAWRKDIRQGRAALGIAAGILGLGSVISSSLIYMLPSRPVWNSGWVPVSFLGTVLLLGGFGSAAFVVSKDDRRLPRALLTGAILGSIIAMVSAVWMLASLSRAPENAFVSVRLQQAMQLFGRPIYWVPLQAHLLLTVILPVALVFRLWPGCEFCEHDGRRSLMIRLGFIAIAVGVLIGRAGLYSLGLFTQPF
jgi:anaerobic dimethyl sulfoxide reductase subunit C (anchor subunit)